MVQQEEFRDTTLFKSWKDYIEITDILNTTEKKQYNNTYHIQGGLYNSDNPSISSINCSSYREKIKIAQKKTFRKNNDIAKKNKWDEIY